MKISAQAREEPDPRQVLPGALLSVADRLALGSRLLARIIGCSEATVSRLRNGRPIDPGSKEGELSLLLIRMYRSLNAILGGSDEQSRLWLTAHNRHLNSTPLERIQSVEGLVDVIQYLDAMRGRI